MEWFLTHLINGSSPTVCGLSGRGHNWLFFPPTSIYYYPFLTVRFLLQYGEAHHIMCVGCMHVYVWGCMSASMLHS